MSGFSCRTLLHKGLNVSKEISTLNYYTVNNKRTYAFTEEPLKRVLAFGVLGSKGLQQRVSRTIQYTTLLPANINSTKLFRYALAINICDYLVSYSV